ncbi:protein TonB-like, partial [Amia ocellicauda]|uniref:protein TonB-like n=1 Tax=Amia ocellicauda TaxID=2972642 RepID=UPI0034649662
PSSSREGRGKATPRHRGALSEPLRRANRVRLNDPLDEKQGVFARVAINGSGRVGVATNCMKCVIGSKESPDLEKKFTSCLEDPEFEEVQPPQPERPPPPPRRAQPVPEPQPEPLPQPQPQPQPRPQSRPCARQTLEVHGSNYIADPSARNARSCSVPRKRNTSPAGHALDSKARLRWQGSSHPNYGSTVNLMKAASNGHSLSDSDSSSLDSLGSPELPPRVPDNRRRAVGTLQREMNALFVQKLEEIRSKSPMFFTGKT